MFVLVVLLACGSSVSCVLLGVPPADQYTFPAGIILKNNSEYDFVVVGAGAAGCAAAARLALAGYDVLLVEAGGDPDPISKIPSASMGLLGSPTDWQYRTIPNNKSCLSMRGRQCHFNRGKCLGGSTSINYMQYTRGNRRDYDKIGVPGWTWKDLKPYFLRYEGLQVLNQFPISSYPYHNTTGLIKIEYFENPKNPWQGRIVDGMRALNFPYNIDVNGVSQIGVSRIVGYVYEAERMSTARGYLTRKDVKSKLKVVKNTLCTRVIIDEDKMARGVTLVRKNITYNIYAKREVILSAGTVGTPQILQLSGIGPANHLQEMGIPVRVNLTVGDDMSDHVLPLMLILVDKDNIVDDLKVVAGAAVSFGEYLVSHTGQLASNGITDILSFSNMDCYDLKTRQLKNNKKSCKLPTLQIISAYINRKLLSLGKELFQKAINLNDDVINQISSINEQYSIIVVSPIILQPYSRGNVRLASSDPLQPPAIFPNYLDDPRDADAMFKAITIIEQLVETEPFKQNNASIFHIKLPDCPSFEEDRTGYWQCYLRHLTYAVFHAAGTCAVGRVLDPSLNVNGVRCLRVADLSVLPAVPRGNTEAFSIAVGERVVDFIQQDNCKCKAG